VTQKMTHKLTGLVVLVVGILFFLRDVGINMIGDISGWTIIIVLVGAGLSIGGVAFPETFGKAKKGM